MTSDVALLSLDLSVLLKACPCAPKSEQQSPRVTFVFMFRGSPNNAVKDILQAYHLLFLLSYPLLFGSLLQGSRLNL